MENLYFLKIKDFLLSQSYFFTTRSGPRFYPGHIIREGHLYLEWLGKYFISPKDAAEHTICKWKKKCLKIKTRRLQSPGLYQKYSWFSLFTVVMCYKIATSAELANTEPLHLEKYKVRFLQNSGHIFSSTDQYITLVYVFLCLKVPCLIYVIDLLTFNRTMTHAWMKFI